LKVNLKIAKPKDKSFILWEHLLKSAVFFVGTYALLFFAPLFLDAKTHDSNRSEGIGINIFFFLNKHPEIQLGICLIAVIFINLYVIKKNSSIKYITQIEHDSATIYFQITNLYFTKNQNINIPLTEFEFYFEHTITGNNQKKQKIIFKNSVNNQTIGEINPDHFFWSNHKIQIRNMMEDLNEYRKPTMHTESKSNGIGSIFNQ
jgi:hypothetical protein